MNTDKQLCKKYADVIDTIYTPKSYPETALVKGYVYMCRGIRMVIFKRDHEKVKAGKFVEVMALDPRNGWAGTVRSEELSPVTTEKVSPFFGPELPDGENGNEE